jgi:hypothetical protein
MGDEPGRFLIKISAGFAKLPPESLPASKHLKASDQQERRPPAQG